MLGSIGGRTSFHKASDTIADSLSKVAVLFEDMESASKNMVAQNVEYKAGVTGLVSCSWPQPGQFPEPTAVKCPWPGISASQPMTKDTWNSRSHMALKAANSTMTKSLKQFEQGAVKIYAGTNGQGKKVREISNLFKTDIKKMVDLAVGASVAFAVFVCLMGIIGTLCLNEKSKEQAKGAGMNNSTMAFVATNVFGFVFLLLVIVFVSAEMGVSAAMSDVCYQSPEKAMVRYATNETKTPWTPDNLQAFTHYLDDCQGYNPVAKRLTDAELGLTRFATKAKEIGTCDTLALRVIVPRSQGDLTTIKYAVSCPVINSLFLQFTRDAVCTHMIDGLYNLWSIQCAAGFLLFIALVLMALVQQSFYNDGGSAQVVPEMVQPTKGGPAFDEQNVPPQAQVIVVAAPVEAAAAVDVAPPTYDNAEE